MLAVEPVIAKATVDGVVAITSIGAIITACCENGVKAVVSIDPFIFGTASQAFGSVSAFKDGLFNRKGLVRTNLSPVAITDGISKCDSSLEIAWRGELPRAITEIFERAFGSLKIFDRQCVAIDIGLALQ